MKCNSEEIMVSIRCLVYNHESYLRQCLDGFVMQKTNFRYEAIVHDDASLDNSAKIIREYADKYPDIIRPIYEKENQYSKNDGSLNRIMSKYVRGKYIAMCEGDDYWIDPLKLQKQVDFLENHPECTMVCNRSKRFSERKNTYGDDVRCYSYSRYAKIEDIIMNGGLFIATCSILYRPEIQNAYPDYCKNCHIGDYPLQIMSAMKGKVFYIDEAMSVYRIDNVASWVGRQKTIKLSDKRLCGILSEIRMLQGFAIDYPKYKQYFKRRKDLYIITNCPNKKRDIQDYHNYIGFFSNEIKDLGWFQRLLLQSISTNSHLLFSTYIRIQKILKTFRPDSQ